LFNTTKQEQFHWREVDDEEDEWKWCSMQKIVNQRQTAFIAHE
jgi:hypothetical protein